MNGPVDGSVDDGEGEGEMGGGLGVVSSKTEEAI